MARVPGSRGPEPGAGCIFCRIASGEAPAAMVIDLEDVLAFMALHPLNPGHTLIVPRRHITNIYELPDELAGPILSAGAAVARAAKRAFSADGMTLRQNNEVAGGQDVFHFHLHVIPRHEGDRHRMRSLPLPAAFEEMEAAAAS